MEWMQYDTLKAQRLSERRGTSDEFTGYPT
jgi:hypothetical protein